VLRIARGSATLENVALAGDCCVAALLAMTKEGAMTKDGAMTKGGALAGGVAAGGRR
jgi:hypothetical protein